MAKEQVDEQQFQTEEHLHAKEQHLHAKEQHLHAKEQQLHAKEQQLQAKEQQLHAKEQQLLSNEEDMIQKNLAEDNQITNEILELLEKTKKLASVLEAFKFRVQEAETNYQIVFHERNALINQRDSLSIELGVAIETINRLTQV